MGDDFIKENVSMGSVLAVAGGALLLGALLLAGLYAWEDVKARQESEALLERIWRPQDSEPWVTMEEASGSGAYPGSGECPVGDAANPAFPEGVLGILEIPDQTLTLPVADAYSEALLKRYPCRYGAEELPEEKTVIAGHNYKSHFQCLSVLQAGDEVMLTTVEDSTRRYRVSAVEEISGDDREGLFAGDWELSLFTCAADRTNRLVIRCSEVDYKQTANE